MFEGNVKVELSNNNELEVPNETTLLHVAKNIGSSFSKKAALGYVNGHLKKIVTLILLLLKIKKLKNP
ncbi:hypothetical protein [Mammaliicoccus vitulinus]|uniref:hypothetical protein n=1 Tax=Mammaliicoccus vitulinus TaxID=71237 RepID=UPI001F5465FE|nr:hypothetical protein [Mammaliicoccus vitulinus]